MQDSIEQPEQGSCAQVSATRRALLVCRDPASAKWGPRWLEQSGFIAFVCDNAAEALDHVANNQPDVVIVEASLRDSGGRLLYRALKRSSRAEDLPFIVLCANRTDLHSAIENESVSEVVRKPFDWQLISRRARQIVSHRDHTQQLKVLSDALHTARTDVSQLRIDLATRGETDDLTHLLTRSKFRRVLDQSLSLPGAAPGMAVLLVRLNSFRRVNDALGYENGNRVLLEAASRLHQCLGSRIPGLDPASTASIGRVGGISFAIAVSGLCTTEQVAILAERMLERLDAPVAVAGKTLHLSASIGAALYPDDGGQADMLLHHAETAAIKARERGGGLQFYRQPVSGGSARFLHLDTLLHEALEKNQLYLEYQPILDIAENRVVAAEALLRWNHPVEGNISPAEFVPVAEKTGLMPRIGSFVMETACRQLRQWLDAGCANLRMAINLSLAQLRHDDVVKIVAAALEKWQLPARLVELELSERGVVGRDAEVLRQLHMLKALGVCLSIDDFGTGDASIAYLKELPISALKIDRSYISDAEGSERDATIAASMAALARRLGLTVIAEGVESAAQLQLLREWGCHQYQGFYFSPSVPAGRFLPLAERANQRLNAAEGHVTDLC